MTTIISSIAHKKPVQKFQNWCKVTFFCLFLLANARVYSLELGSYG